jgi:hypothetical protein
VQNPYFLCKRTSTLFTGFAPKIPLSSLFWFRRPCTKTLLLAALFVALHKKSVFRGTFCATPVQAGFLHQKSPGCKMLLRNRGGRSNTLLHRPTIYGPGRRVTPATPARVFPRKTRSLLFCGMVGVAGDSLGSVGRHLHLRECSLHL